jgi:hypothetical protein
MVSRYLDKSLEPVLKKAASEFPAVVLTYRSISGGRPRVRKWTF